MKSIKFTLLLILFIQLCSFEISAQNLFQTMACGDNEGGHTYYHKIPEGSQLTSITVWSGSRVDGISFAYRTPSGNAQETHIGGYGGKRNTTFQVSRNTSIVGMNLRCGSRVDNIQFVFSDGSRTPSYGGGGGHPTSINLPIDVKFRGYYGREGNEVDQIGMIYSH